MADDTYTVERSARMAAPPQRVYAQVVDFHNWSNWSPWDELDPHMQKTFTGAESGVGAVYRWSGNRKAGQGSMTIREAVEPSTVGIDLFFEKPFKARNDTRFTIEPDGDGSRVVWTLTGKKTVLTRVMGVVKSMDAMVGPDFEKGLARLKATVERPATA